MRAIYEPRGRAGEYGDLACNLYTGCSHGCLYCYVPRVLKITRQEFRETVRPREGILEQLERDAANLARRDRRRVFLCFTCDPYQPAEAVHRLARGALERLSDHGIPARILTKNPGLAVDRDLELLRRIDVELGVSLSFSHETAREHWEPHAPSLASRVEALRRAHAAGVRTWVSLEPVIYPHATLEIVGDCHPIVDHWKVGKLNHDKGREATIDWRRFLADVLGALTRYGASYYIKDDLWAFADDEIRGRFPQTNVKTEVGASES